MERWIDGHVAAAYRPTPAAAWTGRRAAAGEYWHQVVRRADWHAGPVSGADFALIGYCCDEGVARNQGRTGAADGPAAIRQQLGRRAWHAGTRRVVDYGDVVCTGGNLEAAQDQLTLMVRQLVAAGQVPLVLGGGHDVAYGHFRGVRGATTPKTGIINFDAHFDLRPVADRPNSGTPFAQLLEEQLTDYLVLGVQRPANPASLFATADANGVEYVLAEHCRTYQLPTIIATLGRFLERNAHVYLTIDLDGFSAAYAPGVSAPSPFGFSPAFVLAVLDYLLATGKVVAVDVAEMNPRYDADGATARLAAGLIERVVSGYPAR